MSASNDATRVAWSGIWLRLKTPHFIRAPPSGSSGTPRTGPLYGWDSSGARDQPPGRRVSRGCRGSRGRGGGAQRDRGECVERLSFELDLEAFIVATGPRREHFAGAYRAHGVGRYAVIEEDTVAVQREAVVVCRSAVRVGARLELAAGGVVADEHERLVNIVSSVVERIGHRHPEPDEAPARL